jgi:hypothetical protein
MKRTLSDQERDQLEEAFQLVSSRLTTRITERCRGQAKRQTTESGRRCLQEAFARHLRDIGRTSPAERYARVVLVIDNALASRKPDHQGAPRAASSGVVPVAQLQSAVASHRTFVEGVAAPRDP